MGRRNAIIDAYTNGEDEDEILDSESEDALEEAAEEDAEEFTSAADAGEFSDEEVVEMVDEFDNDQRAAVERSRQRGRISTRGRRPGREGRAKAEARSRTAVRQREVEADWQPANTLEAPPARPGMEQRWIRFQLGDKNDPRNWTRKLRERWSPRTLDTVPDEFTPPTFKHTSLGEVIGVGDLILCERPKEIGIARRRYFRDKTNRQLAAAEHRAVDKAQGKGGPKIKVASKRDTPTLRRGTRRAEVQDDDQ